MAAPKVALSAERRAVSSDSLKAECWEAPRAALRVPQMVVHWVDYWAGQRAASSVVCSAVLKVESTAV